MNSKEMSHGVKKHVHAQYSFSAAATATSLQSCWTLCDPVDGSPPGSPVPGILQASTLENSMDRGVWWPRVHGITKSHMTECVDIHTHTHTHILDLTELSYYL